MKKFICMIVALVLSAALANVANATPKNLASLQPFQTFKKGAGEGVAYSYTPRTKEQFVAILRSVSLARKEMRVSCEKLVAQMMEAHTGLTFEGCEGAAAALQSDDFADVACTDDMFKKNWLTVTNSNGTAWGVWHRSCLPGERVLVYKGQPLISLTCLNVVIPAAPPPIAQKTPVHSKGPTTLPTPVFATDACQNGFTLIANAWSRGSLTGELRDRAEALIDSANKRNSKEATDQAQYQVDALSRTLGKRLREEVKLHAQISGDEVQVRYIDSQSSKVMRELGTMKLVRGVGKFHFVDDPRAHVVETVWPMDFVSPAMSGGERRLRMFPKEWGTFCTMNVHGVLLP